MRWNLVSTLILRSHITKYLTKFGRNNFRQIKLQIFEQKLLQALIGLYLQLLVIMGLLVKCLALSSIGLLYLDIQ